MRWFSISTNTVASCEAGEAGAFHCRHGDDEDGASIRKVQLPQHGYFFPQPFQQLQLTNPINHVKRFAQIILLMTVQEFG